MTLPPLPTPKGADTFGADYTAAQMESYARAAIAAHVPEADCGNIAAVPAQPLTDEQIHESLCEACSDGSGPVSLAEFRQDEAFADMVAFTRALERRIAAAPQAVPVPAGWVLVPVEPTPEMVAAYLAANHTYWKEMDEGPAPLDKWRNGTPAEATAESYRAMLAAAPKEQP